MCKNGERICDENGIYQLIFTIGSCLYRTIELNEFTMSAGCADSFDNSIAVHVHGIETLSPILQLMSAMNLTPYNTQVHSIKFIRLHAFVEIVQDEWYAMIDECLSSWSMQKFIVYPIFPLVFPVIGNCNHKDNNVNSIWCDVKQQWNFIQWFSLVARIFMLLW